MIIAIDFDGTIVDHCFPDVGAPVPGALYWMKRFKELGAQLILWTMRSNDREKNGSVLTDAVKYCESNSVTFIGVNQNPNQHRWTSSPKVYAHIYIDDAALGCPLHENPRMGGRPYVDWDAVGPAVEKRLLEGK